jgi:pyruvate,orthophosphate dikinase
MAPDTLPPAHEVVAFDDTCGPDVDLPALLGGKGAGLVEMTQRLGLPVPPGFILTTTLCRRYLAEGWPAPLEGQLDTHLERLAQRTGRRFGDPARPLLVAVRAGAPVSMPGMLETLLNVGMTPAIRDRLADEAGDGAFAADTWLRFCRMFAEVVLDLPREAVARAAASDGSLEGTRAATERVQRLAADLAPPGIPAEPRAQLRSAIEAVFRSWHAARAQVFRAREGVSEQLGTAVTVQAMVFGNLDDRSGTGVVFTRNPATGARELFGDYLPRAQGEDVVAGTHAVADLARLRRQLPTVYTELLAILDRLERHYRDLCDVEFTVSRGTLYVLQTRIGRRSPLAAVRIAVAMAEDPGFPLTKSEAVARVDAAILRRLAAVAPINPAATPVATGRPASPGVGVGVLCCDPTRAAELSAGGLAVVLAREATSPADVRGMVGAAALLTTTGGVASHAAVVARGWGIPAVTGVSTAAVSDAGITVGDLFIPAGETLTVDGSHGALYRGDQRAAGAVAIEDVHKLRQWAAELGVEPGAPAGLSATPSEARAVSLVEVVRTVQLKGLCPAAQVAAALATSAAAVEARITEAPALLRTTARGFALTPVGRSWVAAALAAERTAVDRAALDACYAAFTVLNVRFKRLVRAWQVAAAGGIDDTGIATMRAELGRVHAALLSVLATAAGQCPRLQSYAPRFVAALAQLEAGDRSMLASPLKDSYHTVWFEYHEELLALCGRDRLAEERAEQ